MERDRLAGRSKHDFLFDAKLQMDSVIVCSKIDASRNSLVMCCRSNLNPAHQIHELDLRTRAVSKICDLPHSSLGYSDIEIVKASIVVVNQDSGRVSVIQRGQVAEAALIPRAFIGLNSFSNLFCRAGDEIYFISKTRRSCLVRLTVREQGYVVRVFSYPGHLFSHVKLMDRKIYAISTHQAAVRLAAIKSATMKLQVVRGIASKRPTTLSCDCGLIVVSDNWNNVVVYNQLLLETSRLALKVGSNPEMQTIRQANHLLKILITRKGRFEYRLLTVSMDGNKSVFNLSLNTQTGEMRQVSHKKAIHSDVVSGLSFVPNTEDYLSTDRDGTIQFFRCQDQSQII